MNSIKKSCILLLLILLTVGLKARQPERPEPDMAATSIGMVITTNDTETLWNALRLANYAREEGDTVTIFLLGKGVELDDLIKSEKHLSEQSEGFLENGGVIMGCGTCLQSRKKNEPQVCSLSTMGDLYAIIRSHSIVITF